MKWRPYGFQWRVGDFFNTLLGLEISPMTYIGYTDQGDPNFQMLAYFAYHIHLGGNFYYPIRAGLGMVAVNTLNDEVGFQQRLDLVGFAFNVGHILLDFHLPTFRHVTDFDGSLFSWQPGVAASYLF